MNDPEALFQTAQAREPATNDTPLSDKVNGRPPDSETETPEHPKTVGNPRIAEFGAETRIGTLSPGKLGRLSGQARKRRREQFEHVLALSLKQAKELSEMRSEVNPITVQRLNLLNEQIESTRDALNVKRLEPRDRAQLLNALDRLLERERILRGIAAPAPFRAPRQTRQSSNNTAEPL